MGSLLAPVLAKVFMTELEIAIHLRQEITYKTENNFQMIHSRLCYFRKIGSIVNQLNSFDENIQFTFEMEEENNLTFLDVMVIRNTNDTINTTV